MNVHFIVTMSEKGMEAAEKQGFHEYFKLTTKVNTSNMVCFDFDGKIKKYNTPEEIIEDFYPKRLAFYQKRKVRVLFPSLSQKAVITILSGLPCQRAGDAA